MKEPVYNKILTYIKILINLLFVAFVILFIFLALPKILSFFLPFVIGLIVSMIANPLVRFLETKVKILRKHSSAIIIIVVIGIIVGAVYLLMAILFREISELKDNLPVIIEQTEKQYISLSDKLHNFSSTLPVSIQDLINNFFASIGDYASDFVNNKMPSFDTAGNLAKSVADGFLMVIVSILSAYFFISDREILLGGLKMSLPDTVTDGWFLIYSNFKTAVGGYFKAQFKIMLILTVIMFIGFEISHVGYSFLLALGIAFLDLLPVFGTGAVLWPWAIVEMIMGNYMRAVGLVIIYLICQVVKQILQPKMVGDSIGISPLATLVFMFIGYRFYGVIGLIIGVPFGMVLVNLYHIGMFDRTIRGFKIIIHDINEFRKF